MLDGEKIIEVHLLIHLFYKTRNNKKYEFMSSGKKYIKVHVHSFIKKKKFNRKKIEMCSFTLFRERERKKESRNCRFFFMKFVVKRL